MRTGIAIAGMIMAAIGILGSLYSIIPAPYYVYLIIIGTGLLFIGILKKDRQRIA